MHWKKFFICVKKQKNAHDTLVPLMPTEESGKQIHGLLQKCWLKIVSLMMLNSG